MPDWTREYFERGYAQRWGLPPPSDKVRLEVAGLGRLLELAPGSRVVDDRLEELRAALERVGLSFVGALANPDGSRFEPTSPAMWIVAERRDAS